MTVVLSMEHAASIAAIQAHEGPVSTSRAERVLSQFLDLSLNVPSLDVRRIGMLMRQYLGEGEAVIQRAFGQDAVAKLAVAVAHNPLGSARFLRRLAHRVTLLAEYSQDGRNPGAVIHLSESQWVWIILAQRWPEFRRLVSHSGRAGWLELRSVIGWLTRGEKNSREVARSSLAKMLEADLSLRAYLRLHAEGFHQGLEGLVRVERMMRTAGL